MLIDMDYFFVACEEIKRPELRNKPTIVGAEPKEGRGRGVVMTCNYVARKYGIHSAMPISTAYKIKPDAVFLPMDYSYYEQKSNEVIAILREYADRLEQVSIDEAFLDISTKVKDYEEAAKYAERIKAIIKEKAKLPCSIGISSSKLIAKMACEKAKPNGLKLVKPEETKEFIKGMDVGELYGVGKKTAEKLQSLGYSTVGDLAKANKMGLMDRFGSFGLELYNYSNGIDEGEVQETYEVKSMSRERTFEHDTDDSKQILKAIAELSKEVVEDVNKQGMSFKVVTFKTRYSDFSEHLKSKSIKPSNNLEDVIDTASVLYTKFVDKERKIRKIGVRVSGLTNYKSQKRLF